MNSKIKRRTFLALLPFARLAQATRTASESSLIAELEKQIPKFMEASSVPGLSIAIVKDGKLLWRRGFGFKDSASKAPVDNDTVFEAASMSKPVFAYAVMKLCEKGVMNLDTPLTRYTSERFLEGDSRLELITARQVLSHTTGFQNWRSDQEPLKIHFTPGEKYSYSGEGYNYLQSVLTHLAGQPIDPYMRANLFEPFGMTSSGYVWTDAIDKHMSRGHDKSGKPFETQQFTPAEAASAAARYAAAGSLDTTATDYAKFLIEVIDPKPRDAYRLSRESLSEMVRPHVKVGESSSWALGWEIQHGDKRDFITHGGDNKGFHGFAAASVDRKWAYVVLTNGDGGPELLPKLIFGDLIPRLVGEQ